MAANVDVRQFRATKLAQEISLPDENKRKCILTEIKLLAAREA